jgi:hypothetical protein
VFNGNETPVEINSIAGSLTDDSGKLVTASYAYPFLGYLGTDESSPFVMIYNAPIGQADLLTNYTLYSDSETTNPISSQAISFTTNNHKYQDSNGDTHLVGFLINNSSQPMSLYLLAGAYDADVNCIDANSIFLPVPINPGQSMPYDFTMWSVIDAVPSAYDNSTQFKVNIDWLSSNTASVQSSLLVTKEDTHIFSGSVGTFNGTVINNTGKDLSTVIVIVTLYDKSTGDLIATNYSYVTETMTNNSSGKYQVYLYPQPNVDPENVKIEITALGQ